MAGECIRTTRTASPSGKVASGTTTSVGVSGETDRFRFGRCHYGRDRGLVLIVEYAASYVSTRNQPIPSYLPGFFNSELSTVFPNCGTDFIFSCHFRERLCLKRTKMRKKHWRRVLPRQRKEPSAKYSETTPIDFCPNNKIPPQNTTDHLYYKVQVQGGSASAGPCRMLQGGAG